MQLALNLPKSGRTAAEHMQPCAGSCANLAPADSECRVLKHLRLACGASAVLTQQADICCRTHAEECAGSGPGCSMSIILEAKSGANHM